MTFPRFFENGVFIRLLSSVLLAVLAAGLFLLNRPTLEQHPASPKDRTGAVASDIDREIDTVLSRFGIDRSWVRKRTIATTAEGDSRVERRVTIPPNIPSVAMNLALNGMARKHDGRAIATENLKEHSVTIHIEVDKKIIETIILVVRTDLKRGGDRVVAQARV
jgi:hypothetical protein